MRKIVMALLSTTLVAGTAAASDLGNNVKIKGDLRYRHEVIKNQDTNARNRQRIRARIGIEGKISDMGTIYFRLASGSSDPTSTNQTLTDGFSTKGFNLDMAYFRLHQKDLPGFTLMGGKMPVPFFMPNSSHLIWDDDLNPEGAALKFERALNENVTLGLVGSGLWIEERANAKNSWIAGGSGRLAVKLNDKLTDVAVGGGFFDYVNIQGYPFFYHTTKSFGNSVAYIVSGTDSTAVYNSKFQIAEGFVQVTHQFNQIPASVYGDLAYNTAADSNETGWLVGISVGHAKKPGTWALSYNYREVKADAVVGQFTDSDFRDGGTDGKGHVFGGKLAVAKNMTVGATYFINTQGLTGPGKDFHRLQADLQLAF